MIYKLQFTAQAEKDISILKKTDISSFKKLGKLLLELGEHPYTGIGKPEKMKHGYSGCYSRRITQKHRLVYSIDNEKITVLILSASGHYQDK